MNLEFKQTGYGQWNVSTIHRRKKLSIHFTDAPTYDLIKARSADIKQRLKI